MQLPLVGRREELDFIGEAFDDPQSHGVVLAGAIGVGKTRLAREALDLAQSKGLAVVWASGTQAAAALPFGALAHLLPLEPLFRGPFNSLNVLGVAADGLVERARTTRLVLVLDDAHLLDDASAALVHHVAAVGRALVVATVRSGESAPDALVALWKEGRAERLEVQPLSQTEMEELVEHILGGQVDGTVLHQLWKLTGGNPLFLREVLLGGREQNILVEADGVWRWKGPMAVAPRVVEVIEARLGRLEYDERAALEIVAAAGVVGVELLESLVSRRGIEGGERRGLLEEWVDGRRRLARLAHPLYGEVLRAQTPPQVRRELSRRLADGVDACGTRRRGDLLTVATWRLEGGGSPRAGLFVDAASRAVAGGDFVLGERLARAAVDTGGGFEGSQVLAQALIGSGRFQEAEDILAGLQGEVRSEIELVQTVNARAWNLFWHLGAAEKAIALTASAETALATSEFRDQLRTARAGYLVFAGRTQEAFDLVADLLSGSELPPGTLQWLGPVAWGLCIAGRTDQAIRVLDRQLESVTLVGETPLAHDPSKWLRASRAAADFLAGRLTAASAAVQDLYDEALELPSLPNHAALAWSLGLVRLAQGRVSTATRLFREAAATLREVDMFKQLPLCLGNLAQAEALLGNVEAAEKALTEAETVRVPSLSGDEFHIQLGHAWTAAARGELSAAAAIALDAAEVTGSVGEYAQEATALHDAARLGESRQASERLTSLAERVDGLIAGVYALHARALAERQAAGLEEASNAFENLGAMLLAAEAAAEAARAHRDAGRKGTGLAWSTRARALAEQCEGAFTPALAELERELPLTRREREIATLASRGLTNREIAERLVLSMRTVDNHLHSVYTKLGVSGRDELGVIFDRPSALTSDPTSVRT